MKLIDNLHYLVLGNRLSEAIIYETSAFLEDGPARALTYIDSMLAPADSPVRRLFHNQHFYIHLAGLCGITGIMIGLHGHRYLDRIHAKDSLRSKLVFGNIAHLFNSVMLIAVPHTKYPLLIAPLTIAAGALISAPLYYHAFTGKNYCMTSVRIGCTCMVLSWLTMML